MDRTYPLEDISKAYEYVLTGQKQAMLSFKLLD